MEHRERCGHEAIVAPGAGPAAYARADCPRPVRRAPPYSSFPIGLPSMRLDSALTELRPTEAPDTDLLNVLTAPPLSAKQRDPAEVGGEEPLHPDEVGE